VIGLSNALVTLTTTLNCTINGAALSETVTYKLVGSF
jgi:hypothetical protein